MPQAQGAALTASGPLLFLRRHPDTADAVPVIAPLHADGAGIIAGFQHFHERLRPVRVGQGAGRFGIVVVLDDLGADPLAVPQRRLQVGDLLLAHPEMVAAVVAEQHKIGLLNFHRRGLPGIVFHQRFPFVVRVQLFEVFHPVGEQFRVAHPPEIEFIRQIQRIKDRTEILHRDPDLTLFPFLHRPLVTPQQIGQFLLRFAHGVPRKRDGFSCPDPIIRHLISLPLRANQRFHAAAPPACRPQTCYLSCSPKSVRDSGVLSAAARMRSAASCISF